MSVTLEREGDTVVIKIPMDLKRRAGRKEIIVPEGLPGTEQHKSPTQEPLVTALARAFHWQELIDSGKYSSITELAEALGVDRSYVGRILRLTLLAPDMVEAIVSGNEPSGLSLERLVRAMPELWEKQRRRFGFRHNASVPAIPRQRRPTAGYSETVSWTSPEGTME